MAQLASPGLRLVSGVDHLSAPLRVVESRQALGRRMVGVTTLLGVLALGVLLGLALFHSALAGGQYQLSQLEQQVDAERQHIVELQFQLESMTSPAEVELIAHGVLGLVNAAEPIDLVVNPEHIEATARVDDAVMRSDATDWLAVKPLLASN